MFLRRPFAFGVSALGLSLLVLAASRAGAAENCDGWFCDDGAQPDAPPVVATVPTPAGGTDVLAGTITEVVPGDHLTLRLPNGELRTLAWAELLQLQVSGKIVIGPGAAPAPAPAPAPPTVIVAPAPPPARVIAPPPAPMVDEPEPAPRRLPRPFEERASLGLRLNFLSPGDESRVTQGGAPLGSYVGSGTGLELDLGYRISPSWTPYVFYEHGWFRPGDANAGSADAVRSSFAGVGLRANTNPDGPIGFLFDIGVGYRWLTVPFAPGSGNGLEGPGSSSAGRVQYSGFQALRVGLGLSIGVTQNVRFDLALQASAGTFSRRSESGSRCAGICEEIREDDRAIHSFGGISLGSHFDL
jgi:hypothetical protein